jgi:hypothetical protein
VFAEKGIVSSSPLQAAGLSNGVKAKKPVWFRGKGGVAKILKPMT